MPRMTEDEYEAHFESRRVLNKRLRDTLESELQSYVIAEALKMGYRAHHEYDSRRSSPGYFDWTLGHLGKNRLIYVEFKAQNAYLSSEQKDWAVILVGAAVCNDLSPVEVYVWRPSDRDEALDILAGQPLDKLTMKERIIHEVNGPTRGKSTPGQRYHR